jgi:hypothetical protein
VTKQMQRFIECHKKAMALLPPGAFTSIAAGWCPKRHPEAAPLEQVSHADWKLYCRAADIVTFRMILTPPADWPYAT